MRLERLQHLERLEQLQRLQRLQRLSGDIKITNASYLDYTYKSGDVVYCDPPYEDTQGYNGEAFDHNTFYNWVAACEFPVYFSSYEISDNRFKPLWSTKKRSLFNPAKSYLQKNEYVYGNTAAEKLEDSRFLF
jgi:site-specific DNA-adenine methylase